MKIGFIGLGNMGGSLARVVARQKNIKSCSQIEAQKKQSRLRMKWVANLSRTKSSLSKQM